MLANGDTQVTIGSPTAVCLVANPLVWQVIDEGEGVEFYAQVLITPDADEFSRFSVSGCESIKYCTDTAGIFWGVNGGQAHPPISHLDKNSEPRIISSLYPCQGYAADFSLQLYTLTSKMKSIWTSRPAMGLNRTS